MYLSKRGNTYYIRFRQNGTEIKRSLQTGSKRIATLKVRQILEGQGLQSLIKYKGMNLADFVKKVQDITYTYIDKAIVEFSELESLRFKDLGRFDHETIHNKICDYSDIVFDFNGKRKLKPTALPIINRDEELKAFLKELKEKEEQELFYELLIKAETQVLKNDLQRVVKLKDMDYLPIAQKEAKKQEQGLKEAVYTPQVQNIKIFSVENLDELEEIFQKFIDDEISVLNKHTITEYKAGFRLLKQFIQETNYSLPLVHEAKRELQDTIRHYPKNPTKLPEEYRNLSISELVGLTKNGILQKRALASQQKQGQEINNFFKYLEQEYGYKQEFLTTVTNRRKETEQKRNKDNKRTYADNELTMIFTALQKQRENFPERFWLSWLHLFAGMRTNEIGQLTFENIVKNPTNGIWYIDIVDKEPFQKLKPRSPAKRKVPIHSFLIELGFLKFYNKRLKEIKNKRGLILPIYNKRGRTTPLFELTEPPSKDFCDGVADWFNSKLLENLEIKSSEVSIYSLRHTFTDAMKRFNDSYLISEIMGHKSGTTTTETVYGTERALVMKKEAVEKLWFETFDFKKLLK